MIQRSNTLYFISGKPRQSQQALIPSDSLFYFFFPLFQDIRNHKSVVEHKDPHCTELRTPSEEKQLVKQRNYALSTTYSPEGRLSPEKCISITPGMDVLHLYLCPPIKSVVKIYIFFPFLFFFFASCLHINIIDFFLGKTNSLAAILLKEYGILQRGRGIAVFSSNLQV